MSVEYKSAIIYGVNCSDIQERFPPELCEWLENCGLDIISDPYNNKFLYIGKIISEASYGDEFQLDINEELFQQTQVDFYSILEEMVPPDIFADLPLNDSLYHICYAV